MNIDLITGKAPGNPTPGLKTGGAGESENPDSFSRTMEKVQQKSTGNSDAAAGPGKGVRGGMEAPPAEPVETTKHHDNDKAMQGMGFSDDLPKGLLSISVKQDRLPGHQPDADEDGASEQASVAPWLLAVPDARLPDGHPTAGLVTAKSAIEAHRPTLAVNGNLSRQGEVTPPALEKTTTINGSIATTNPEQERLQEHRDSHFLTGRHNSAGQATAPAGEGGLPTVRDIDVVETASRPHSAVQPDTPALPATAQQPGATTVRATLGTEPAHSLPLTAAIDSDGWGEEFGQRMATLAIRGDNRVSLHINPRELGPVTVDLKIVDNQAQLHFVSHHNQVRQAVEQAIPQLREALGEQGISLGEATVSQQQQGGNTNGDPGDRPASPTIEAVTEGDTADRGAAPMAMTIDDGHLSLYI